MIFVPSPSTAKVIGISLFVSVSSVFSTWVIPSVSVVVLRKMLTSRYLITDSLSVSNASFTFCASSAMSDSSFILAITSRLTLVTSRFFSFTFSRMAVASFRIASVVSFLKFHLLKLRYHWHFR